MKIVEKSITREGLNEIAQATFGDMVKAVVDIDFEQLAIDGELHSDLEAYLLEKGSKQKDLWGINLYPELEGSDFIEFDSMINIRPTQGNRSRGVDNKEIRKKIIRIVTAKVSK